VRGPLVASAEVTELRSGALLSARTSELGLGGCYVDALNPFPEGTLVGLQILRLSESSGAKPAAWGSFTRDEKILDRTTVSLY
jgi:hypothetical protein